MDTLHTMHSIGVLACNIMEHLDAFHLLLAVDKQERPRDAFSIWRTASHVAMSVEQPDARGMLDGNRKTTDRFRGQSADR